MTNWQTTSCALCAQNCGLQVKIENNRIVKVRSDKANPLMRNPDWNTGRRAGTLAMHPEDAATLGMKDGEMVRITTEAASQKIELEVTDEARRGQVLIAHGFGLKYQGKTFGVNVNRLTKNTHRDQLAATPIHRYVPCRIEKFVL
jgi:anaerobic selenocysteine-containing dehydrogenase